MEMTQVAFGTASEKKAATELHLCSQMAPRRKTMGLVITVVPRAISERKKKKLKLLTLALNADSVSGALLHIFPFFFSSSQQFTSAWVELFHLTEIH